MKQKKIVLQRNDLFMKLTKKILFIVGVFLIIPSCSKTNVEKISYIKKKLNNTNEHVAKGSWYSKTYGKDVIPDILTDENLISRLEGMQE